MVGAVDQTQQERAPFASLHEVEVVTVTRLTPHLQRVTLSGASLASFPDVGPDQRVKLLLPRKGEIRPHLADARSMRDLMTLPLGRRPIMRTYTVRHRRPEQNQLDIDFALHGHPGSGAGPATSWALTALPGDRIGLFGPAPTYVRPPVGAVHLIVGDESALPAIAAIAERLPAGARGDVIVEVEDDSDRIKLAVPFGVRVWWLVRHGLAAQDSPLMMDLVRSLSLPKDNTWAWLAGESSVVTGMRRHLVSDRGIDRAQVTFTGYWRHGHAGEN